MVLALNGQGFLLHIAQYSAIATGTGGAVELDVVGGVNAVAAAVVVFIVGTNASMKVGNAALDSKKDSSICLTL